MIISASAPLVSRLDKVQKSLSKLREEKTEILAKTAKKVSKIDVKRAALRNERTAIIEELSR